MRNTCSPEIKTENDGKRDEEVKNGAGDGQVQWQVVGRVLSFSVTYYSEWFSMPKKMVHKVWEPHDRASHTMQIGAVLSHCKRCSWPELLSHCSFCFLLFYTITALKVTHPLLVVLLINSLHFHFSRLGFAQGSKRLQIVDFSYKNHVFGIIPIVKTLSTLYAIYA